MLLIAVTNRRGREGGREGRKEGREALLISTVSIAHLSASNTQVTLPPDGSTCEGRKGKGKEKGKGKGWERENSDD